jgi:hypothetical protein
LFVALVYGFATLLLGVGNQHFGGAERLPLVWFVVLFPILVLGVFYRLVTHYHGRLYSPRDYREDVTFLKTLPPEVQAARLQAEVESVQSLPALPEQPLVSSGSAQTPHVSTPPAASQEATDELRHRLLESERLGLLKVETERGLLFRRQVAVGEGQLVVFDGVATTETEFVVVEVKYLREPWVSARTIQDILHRALAAEALLRRRGEGRKLRLLLVFVIGKDTGGGISRLTRLLEAHLKDPPVMVEYEAYFFDDLQKEFGPTRA